MTGGVESAVVTGNSLLAFNRKTRLIWSYDFPSSLRNYRPEELEWRVQVFDLEGSGERGVLIAAQFLNTEIPDTLYYFRADGAIAWQLEADPPIRNRHGKAFERAWAYKHIVITLAKKEKRGVVWAAFGNNAGWAGGVLRIASDGSAEVFFANAGYVERLCPVTGAEGDFLVICGENNDFDDAFAALLGLDDPPACSVPGKRLVYRFWNAPSATARKYILFPRTELVVAGDRPYGDATHIAQHLDGLVVEVRTSDDAHFRYHFSKDLQPRYVFPSGNHEFHHRGFETKGRLSHAWPDCPELQAPLILRVWEPDSGWYDQQVPWRDNPWKEIATPER
jgi:hypothetical protein